MDTVHFPTVVCEEYVLSILSNRINKIRLSKGYCGLQIEITMLLPSESANHSRTNIDKFAPLKDLKN